MSRVVQHWAVSLSSTVWYRAPIVWEYTVLDYNRHKLVKKTQGRLKQKSGVRRLTMVTKLRRSDRESQATTSKRTSPPRVSRDIGILWERVWVEEEERMARTWSD